MTTKLLRISTPAYSHSPMPPTSSAAPSAPNCWRLSAFYAGVIVALLLFASPEVTVAQGVHTGRAEHAKKAPGFRNRKKPGHAKNTPSDRFWNTNGTSAIAGTSPNAPTGTEITNGDSLIASYSSGMGNDLVVTAVPEPGTWVAGGLALAGLICYQRRRFARFFKRKS